MTTNGYVANERDDELDHPESKNPPRLEDLVVIDDHGQGDSNPAAALIEFPDDQGDWVGRSNLDDLQISAILQFRQRSLFWNRDSRMLNFLHFAAGLLNSRGGQGRADYLEGIKGQTPDVQNQHFTQRMLEAKNGNS